MIDETLESSESRPPPPKEKTPRSAIIKYIAATVIVCLVTVIAVSSLVLAVLGARAGLEGEEIAIETATLTESVRAGSVIETLDVEARVVGPKEWSVRPPKAAGGTVTRNGAALGQEITPGQVVAVVDERPVIILPGAIPSYRELVEGSMGSDVLQLQTALNDLGYEVSDAEGVFDISTANAVSRLYEDRGFGVLDSDGQPTSPDSPGTVPLGEIQFVPALPARSLGACGTAGDTAPERLCSISSGDPQVVAESFSFASEQVLSGLKGTLRLGMLEATFTVGNPVQPVAPGESSSSDAEPTSELPVAEAQPEERVVYELVVDKGSEPLVPGVVGTGEIVLNSSSEDSLKVVGTAIRGDTEAAWLETEAGTRVPVEVGLCSGGFCEVSGPEVADGLTVTLVRGGDSFNGSRETP